MSKYEKLFEKDYQDLLKKYDLKSDENKQLRYEYNLLQRKYETKERQLDIAINDAKTIMQPLLDEKDKIIDKKDKIIDNKDKKISALEKEIARLKGLLSTDGTNSGLPTSQTPINKKKVIPNTRQKSNKSKGGQIGHKKHKLEKFNDEEITDNVDHTLEVCPCCHGKLKEIGEICKDELSYRFVPIKRRNHFIKYECTECHKEVHQTIPNHLKEENQYGAEVKSVALTLANEGNVPMNKIRKIISGFSENTINMSEGFIAKLQKQASNNLSNFIEDIKKEIYKQSQIYWDDTVIMINTKRACLRFYGNEKLALYTAHEHKNEEGINEDGILNTLDKNVTVMHDHNRINYKYDYQNIECNVHLIRDLEKCYVNTSHVWCKKFKELVQTIIHDKKSYMEKGYDSFDDTYVNNFNQKYDEILLEGLEEIRTKPKGHYSLAENALILRILEYKDNYFIWMYDFSLPSDDNLSERALRTAKSKMKVSGQFQNINYARYYADIKTYIETCYRNGINPTSALIDLMNDKPLKLSEILAKEKDEKSN